MNKSKRFFLTGIFASLLLAGIGFWFYEKPTVSDSTIIPSSAAAGSALIGDFKSYQSLASVGASLKTKNLTRKTIENSNLSKDDTRPQFSVITVEIENYNDLNFSGVLRMTFFNDRLAQTIFLPKEFGPYESALKAKLKIDISEQPASIDSSTEVSKRKDPEGHEYISWKDTRLKDEQSEWIKRYAHRIDHIFSPAIFCRGENENVVDSCFIYLVHRSAYSRISVPNSTRWPTLGTRRDWTSTIISSALAHSS